MNEEKTISKLRKIISGIFITMATLSYGTTLLIWVNEYATQPETPFTVNIQGLEVMCILVIISVFFTVLAFLVNKRSKTIFYIAIVLLLLNVKKYTMASTVLEYTEIFEWEYTTEVQWKSLIGGMFT